MRRRSGWLIAVLALSACSGNGDEMRYATAEEERDALDATLDELAEQVLPGAPWRTRPANLSGCGAVAPSTTFQYLVERMVDLDHLDAAARAALAQDSRAALEDAGFHQTEERSESRNLIRVYERDGVAALVTVNELRLTLSATTDCLPTAE